jgi:hypothetical protein
MKLGFLKSPLVILALIIYVIADSGPRVVHAVDSVIDGNLIFTGPNQGGAKDIRTSNTEGGLRIFNGQTLSPIPEGAAIQFFGNTSNSYPGQAFIDSGAHNNAALVFRTAGTGQAITERMRVTATGNVGIGTNNPQDQLQLTGNLRLPATSSTAGIIRSGTNTLLHTFGVQNFFAGVDAGNLTMTGDANTAAGTAALQSNTSGSDNTALGLAALQNNTSGESNTAVGRLAMVSNTTGSENTAVGETALRNNSSGINNTAFGEGSLFSNTTGNDNTALGWDAGTTNTTGSNNTFIGANSDATANNFSNATAVGANAQVGASNSLVLGATGTSVGIGTTTPISTLQVVGNYVQIPAITGAPVATDCNEVAETGRMVVRIDGTTNFYVCTGTAWVAVGAAAIIPF